MTTTTSSEATTAGGVSTATEEASPSVSGKKGKKNPKPLRLLVHPMLAGSPELTALAEKGHEVEVMDLWESYDLLLGPTCWRMDLRLIKHLDSAVKSARAVKYPKKEKVSDGVSAE